MRKLSLKTENILLTSINCILTVASVGVAIHDTMKAIDICNQLKTELDEPDVKTEIKTKVKCYIPTIAVTSIAIGSIIATGVRNNKIQTLLATTAISYMTQYDAYRKHAIDILGDDKDNLIMDKVAEDQYKLQVDKLNAMKTDVDDTLFFDDYSGRFFWSNRVDVLQAEHEINRQLTLGGEVEINELYYYLGMFNNPAYDAIGWADWIAYGEDCSSEDSMDALWIGMEHTVKQLQNGQTYVNIKFKRKPEYLD